MGASAGVCSEERVGSLGSLALEPWLAFWREAGGGVVGGLEGSVLDLELPTNRKEQVGGTFRDRGRMVVPVSPPRGGAERATKMGGRL